MAKKKVSDFIIFALSHARRNSVPAAALLPVPLNEVGGMGEWVYLYGTTGWVVTLDLLNQKFDDYYSKHNWTRDLYDEATAGFIGRIACDCQGLLDNFVGKDTNADTCYNTWCTGRGTIKDNQHYDIGECFFIDKGGIKKHVGFVCGYMPDGEEIIVEERGIRYGCMLTLRSERPWTHHGKATKVLDYTETVDVLPYDASPVVFNIGDKGDLVTLLQSFLVSTGYTDGNGNALVVDGKLGAKTWYALSTFAAAHIDVADIESTDVEPAAILTLDNADQYTICVYRTNELPKEV